MPRGQAGLGGLCWLGCVILSRPSSSPALVLASPHRSTSLSTPAGRLREGSGARVTVGPLPAPFAERGRGLGTASPEPCVLELGCERLPPLLGDIPPAAPQAACLSAGSVQLGTSCVPTLVTPRVFLGRGEQAEAEPGVGASPALTQDPARRGPGPRRSPSATLLSGAESAEQELAPKRLVLSCPVPSRPVWGPGLHSSGQLSTWPWASQPFPWLPGVRSVLG